MTRRCATCDLPIATEADHESCPSGCQCERCCSLCWSSFGGQCNAPAVDWRARALAAEQATTMPPASWRTWSIHLSDNRTAMIGLDPTEDRVRLAVPAGDLTSRDAVMLGLGLQEASRIAGAQRNRPRTRRKR